MTIDNWIKTEDGLPEDSDDVIVYLEQGLISLGEYVNRRWHVYGTPYTTVDSKVTHWKPLPKAPPRTT